MSESPYAMLREAEEKMKTMILELDPEKEERVIELINAASSYPTMSKYQVMKARVFLIDLYISHEIYGNAYDLCLMTLEEYPKAPVKKKLKSMEKIRDERPGDFAYSKSIDLADPDMCFVEEGGTEDYDPVFEAEVEAILNLLPPGCRDDFYAHRSMRTNKDCAPFTKKEVDMLELRAMAKSFGVSLDVLGTLGDKQSARDI
ncbi:MAG: hypothetical protein LUD72_11560 [Bacteroidales bacterium]|nr:hypothetical protein [Bacteroidales bacterium]